MYQIKKKQVMQLKLTQMRETYVYDIILRGGEL